MSESNATRDVSVAIVTYNQREYLREALDSVLAQTGVTFEVVVGDDGSTDGTPELLNAYAARHPGVVRPVLSPANRGITANCNAVLDACAAPLIAWLGGDDLMLPGKLAAQVQLMQKDRECGLCYHDLEVFESDTGALLRHFNSGPGSVTPREGGAELLVRYGTFCGACSVMVRRSAVPTHGFDPRIPVASDWLFWIETAVNGTIRYLPRVLGRYRRHRASVTARTTADDQHERLITLALVESRYPQLAGAARLNRAHYLYGEGVTRVLTGRGREARTLLRESLRQGTVSWKWAGWYARSFLARAPTQAPPSGRPRDEARPAPRAAG